MKEGEAMILDDLIVVLSEVELMSPKTIVELSDYCQSSVDHNIAVSIIRGRLMIEAIPSALATEYGIRFGVGLHGVRGWTCVASLVTRHAELDRPGIIERMVSDALETCKRRKERGDY